MDRINNYTNSTDKIFCLVTLCRTNPFSNIRYKKLKKEDSIVIIFAVYLHIENHTVCNR